MARSSRAERMRRLLLEDSRDDSSSAGTSEMKHNPCPFDMPSTRNESKEDDSSVRTNEEDLSNEYKPLDLEIETPLSIGEIDSFARIDGIDDSFDLEALDRHQDFSALSNRVVDVNQLKNSPFTVRSIDAHSNPDVIDQWIYAVEEVHATAKTKKASATKSGLPNVEKLMKPLPKEMEDALNSGEAFLPSADIDMSLEEYARVMCSLFGIPVKESLVDGIHKMMCLLMEYKDREASNEISVTVEDWS